MLQRERGAKTFPPDARLLHFTVEVGRFNLGEFEKTIGEFSDSGRLLNYLFEIAVVKSGFADAIR